MSGAKSCALLPRRSLLKSVAALPLILAGGRSFSQEQFHQQGFWDQPRSVWLKRPATGEEVRATYWADGELIQGEYYRICMLMRDVQMDRRIKSMQAMGQPVSPQMYSAVSVSLVLLDILYATGGWLVYHNMDRPILLTSGFRHPATNSITEGAAMNSHHTKGRAGDIVIPGVNAANVSAYGRWLSAGGVGWYERKSFTHIDDGRMRSWRG